MRFSALVVLVIATLAAVVALWLFRDVLGLLLLSIAVAGALRPVVDRLTRRGLSLSISLAIAYVATLGLGGLLVYELGTRLAVEIPIALDRAILTYGEAAQTWPGSGGLRGAIGKWLVSTGDVMENEGLAESAMFATLSVVNLLASGALVLVMSIYWSTSRDALERLWLSLLPVDQRKRARSIWMATRIAVGAQLRREVGLSVLAAMLLALGFKIMGSELWALPAIAVAILRLIPLLGGLLAMVAAFAAGLNTGWVTAVIMATLTLSVLGFLRWKAPRWFTVPNPINPVLHVLVVLALASAFGLAGLIAAPLVSAAIYTVITEMTAAQAIPPEAPTIEQLRARALVLHRHFERGTPSPAHANLLARLEELIERAAKTPRP
jgi:predicted PurR-regulated permease PerM